jgi:protein gp37
MGVSVERQDYAFRIDHLRASRARLKFLSLEGRTWDEVPIAAAGAGHLDIRLEPVVASRVA